MNYPTQGSTPERHYVARLVVEEVDKTDGTKPQRDKREVASFVVTGKSLTTVKTKVIGHVGLLDDPEQDE